MNTDNATMWLPAFAVVAGGLVAIPLGVSLFLGGSLTAVPASLGGGESNGFAWHGLAVLVGIPTAAVFLFKKTLDHLDRAPPSRR